MSWFMIEGIGLRAANNELHNMYAELLAAARHVLLAVDDEGSASGDVRRSIEQLRAAVEKEMKK